MRHWQSITRGAKLILRPRAESNANGQVSILAPRPCHDYYLQFLGMSMGRDESVSGAFLIGRFATCKASRMQKILRVFIAYH